MNKEDVENLHMKLILLIVGCGLPFSLVENIHFKNFVKALNEPYSKKLPSRRTLSETHLDKLYDDVIKKSKSGIPKNVCLLSDSWRNKAGKQENFAIIIHNANGTPFFVDTFDFTNRSENAENLKLCVSYSEIVSELNVHNNSYFRLLML